MKRILLLALVISGLSSTNKLLAQTAYNPPGTDWSCTAYDAGMNCNAPDGSTMIIAENAAGGLTTIINTNSGSEIIVTDGSDSGYVWAAGSNGYMEAIGGDGGVNNIEPIALQDDIPDDYID